MPKNNVVYVPVDPQMYGLGMLAGCLITFWPVVLLVLACVLFGGLALSGGHNDSTYIDTAEQTKVAATESVIQAIHQDKVIKGLANLQNYQGIWDISKTDNSSDGSVTITYIEFTSEGINIFIDSVLAHVNVLGPELSCLSFTPLMDYFIKPTRYDFKEVGDIPGKSHRTGYAFYPRFCTQNTCPGGYPYRDHQYLDFWLIPERFETHVKNLETYSSVVYFKHGCSVFSNPIQLFDFADFAN